jgi:hypothetical protein
MVTATMTGEVNIANQLTILAKFPGLAIGFIPATTIAITELGVRIRRVGNG